MASILIDGNDALACYQGVKAAREYSVKEKKPVLVEFLTYRIGDHSTSDNSLLYRSEEEIKSWKTENNPIDRLGVYLRKSGKRDLSEA